MTARRRSRPRLVAVLTICVYVLSSALIVAAARGDLWMDEVWSIWIARSVSVASEILRLHIDNNHVLNTLFQYWVQGQHPSYVYRIPAVFAGAGSLFLIGTIARREWGEAEALAAVVVAGLSYPLVLYFSEARGYALAMFFALAAYELLRRNLAAPTSGRLVGFWIVNALGILSHLTFGIVFLSCFAMHLMHASVGEGSRRSRLFSFLMHQAPAGLVVGGWAAYFGHDMGVAGGPVYAKWHVVGEASALLLGMPRTTLALIGAMAVVLVVILAGSTRLLREKDSAGLFFSMMLVFFPFLFLFVAKPTLLYVRYFVVCFPFFYLLFARVICILLRSPRRAWRPVVAGSLCAMFVGHAASIVPLLVYGRGNYMDALARILQQSSAGVVRVGSDHDFRNQMLVTFYAPLLPGGDRVRYVEATRWSEEPPDWLLTHSQDQAHRPPKGLEAGHGGAVYQLIGEYRYAGISGWNWYLFQRRIEPGLSK